jgi:hypothetical protein
MRKHWRRFTYNEDDGYTTDDVPDDAFHSIMEILSLRRVPRYRPVASFEPPIMWSATQLNRIVSTQW